MTEGLTVIRDDTEGPPGVARVADSQLPAGLELSKLAARQRAKAAEGYRKDFERRASAESRTNFQERVLATVGPELAPYLVWDTPEPFNGLSHCEVGLEFPGHRTVWCKFASSGLCWEAHHYGMERPEDDVATAARARWRFHDGRRHRYFHDLGAALVAAELPTPEGDDAQRAEPGS